MKYLIVIFLSILTQQLVAQQRLRLRIGPQGEVASADYNIIIREFSNGRAPFMIKGKQPFNPLINRVGFVDSAGKVLIKPVYINCSPFENGRALVQDTSAKFGIIDTTGHAIIPVIYDWLFRCDNGLYFVIKNQKLGLLTAAGKTIFPPERYTAFATPPRAYYVSEEGDTPDREFNWTLLSQQPSVRFKDFIGVKTEKLWGAINRQGKEIIPPAFESIGIFIGNAAQATKDNKYGVIDTVGNWLIPPVYGNAMPTPFGTAIIASNKKMGVVSLQNTVLLPPVYDQVTQVSAHNFLIKQTEGNRYGVVDDKNIVLIPIENHFIGAFGSGFVVEGPNRLSALFNSKGQRISDSGTYHYQELAPPVWRFTRHDDSVICYVYNRANDKFVTYSQIIDNRSPYEAVPRRIAYYRDKKWGLLDTSGTEITLPVYDDIRFMRLGYTGVLTFAKQNNHWGIIDSAGKVLDDFIYDDVNATQTFLWVTKNGRCGMIFNNLNYRTPVKYDVLFLNARWQYQWPNAILVKANNKWGFINRRGKEIAPCIYDEFAEMQPSDMQRSNFMTPMRLGQKWGFLDKNLQPATPFKYDSYTGRGNFIVTVNNMQGLLDTAGKELIPCIYDKIVLGYDKMIYVVKNGLYGIMDWHGKLLVETKYQSIGGMKYEFDRGKLWYLIKQNNKTGLMDAAGRENIPCVYDELRMEKKGNISAKKNGKWGMISFSNKTLIPFQYEWIDEIALAKGRTKLVYITKLDNKYGLINASNKIIIPFAYDDVNIFRANAYPGPTCLIRVRDGSKSGLLNWAGKVVLPLNFLQIYDFSHNYEIVGMDEKYGMLDLEGKQLLPPVYDFINSGPHENYEVLSKGKKVSIITHNAKFLYKDAFDSYDLFLGFDDAMPVIKDGKYGMLDCDAKLVYPCIYKKISYEDGCIIVEKF